MTINANDYPTTPLTTSVPVAAGATLNEEIVSLQQYDNTEIELIQISRGATPLLSTIIGIGRQLNGGNFKDLGITEKTWVNFPKYTWKEKDEHQELYVVTTGGNAAATSVKFASNVGLIAGHVLRNVTTNEMIKVSALVSTDEITITRAVGTVTADTITAGDKLLIVSTAASEGAAKVATTGSEGDEKFNYYQKYLTTVEFTDFQNMTPMIKGMKIKDLKDEQAIVHMREREKSALYGQRGTGTDTAWATYYTAEWVIPFASKGWSTDISSGLTRGTIEETLAEPLRYTKNGSTQKILVTGTKAKSAISEVFEGRLLVGQISAIDLTLDRIKINTGDFILLDHPMLDSNSGYEGHAVCIDPAFINIAYPTGQDVNGTGFNGKTRFEYLANESNFAKQVGSWVTYQTMILQNANSGGIFKLA